MFQFRSGLFIQVRKKGLKLDILQVYWFKNGEKIRSITSKRISNGSVVSQLVGRISQEDVNNTYTCQVWDETHVTKLVVSKPIKLKVTSKVNYVYPSKYK